jgi:hypothetical protein
MSNIFSTLTLEQNPGYVDELEAKYKILLSPIFKAFVQTFEFGKFNPSPQHKIIHPNKELGYNGFEHSLEKKVKIYNDLDFDYKNLGILPIIPSGIYQHGICVGLENEKKDNIYLYVDGVSETLRLIAPNILRFISEFKEIHWNAI